jgi:osmoprotectant transport system permease protein
MQYLVTHFPAVARLFWEQVRLTSLALALALLVALPTGFLLARQRWLQGSVLAGLGIIYTLPSLSVLVLLIPFFGLGPRTALVALVAYAQLMLVRNWLVGLTQIPRWTLEAADGMGMSSWQRFWRVEFPLALPMLLAGMRLAANSIIGISTVAALINAGGLGSLLFEGVITANSQKIVAGGLALSVLVIAVNALLGFLEKKFTPPA